MKWREPEKINNPFANREEFVNWSEFHLSSLKTTPTLLEVYPSNGGDSGDKLGPDAEEYGICR